MIRVVTLAFNNFSELKLALFSLESMEEIESIVVNGGSDSDTKAYLDEEFFRRPGKDCVAKKMS